MNPWDQFTGANAGYVYELFERYQRDPSSVDEATRRAFATWTPRSKMASSAPVARRRIPPPAAPPSSRPASPPSTSPSRFAASATWPRDSIRSAFTIRSAIRRCAPQSHGLTTDTLKQSAGRRSSAARPPHGARQRASTPSSGCARSTARPPDTTTTTCSCPTSACGCARRSSRGSSGRPTIRSTATSCSTASRRSRTFERFLHRTFPGKTRFSIEGLDMMVPILDEIITMPPRPACST